MDFLDFVLKWIFAPVLGVIWIQHNRQQRHETEIAVIKATMGANKEAHDREFKELKESLRMIYSKLDSIEQELRK